MAAPGNGGPKPFQSDLSPGKTYSTGFSLAGRKAFSLLDEPRARLRQVKLCNNFNCMSARLASYEPVQTTCMVALASAFPHFTFSSTFRDLGVTLDKELALAPTSTRVAVPVITRSVNFSQFPGH